MADDRVAARDVDEPVRDQTGEADTASDSLSLQTTENRSRLLLKRRASSGR